MSATRKFDEDRDVRKGWRFLTGDTNWETYGGRWFRRGGNKGQGHINDDYWWFKPAHYIVRFDNGLDCCGEAFLTADVKLVDLGGTPAEEIRSALDSCGWAFEVVDGVLTIVSPYSGDVVADDMEIITLVLLEACIGYGLGAPMHSEQFDFALDEWDEPVYAEPERVGEELDLDAEATRLVIRAMEAAEEFEQDEDAREAQLDKPVNRIGSTAREVGRGDIYSALGRSDSPEAALMRKMYAAACTDDGNVRTLGGKVSGDMLRKKGVLE